MKTDIEIVRGTTNTFEITVRDKLGNLYDLKEGEVFYFGVKKKFSDDTFLFVKRITESENGVYTVEIEPQDTENCDSCRYFYDASIDSDANHYKVIETSLFHVKENVTYWGCYP